MSQHEANSGLGSDWAPRKSAWRQGSVLPATCLSALGLSGAQSDGDTVFVVVSHDCDLAERDFDVEPFAEVVEASIFEEPNGNFTYAKSTRTLHIPVKRREEKRYLGLRAATKHVIDRRTLEEFDPDPNFDISTQDRLLIGRWQAIRYKRAALPDALYERLANGKILESIATKGKKAPEAIVGIFIDYDPGSELDDPNEPYELWINVVYKEEKDGAAKEAESLASALKDKIETKFKKGNSWSLIELRQCVAISDLRFSLNSTIKMKMLQLDYISYKQNPPLDALGDLA